MKATEKDIVPGAKLYYVHCVKAQWAKDAKLSFKVNVTSEINTNNLMKDKRFNSVDYYDSSDPINRGHFLSDCGIGEKRYNLHRLFTTKESALAYVEECKSGVFSDPLDQVVYNNDLKKGEDNEYDLWLTLSRHDEY